MPKTYRIGTRGSLLAKTQSTQIKNLLEEKTGNHFELKIIKTQGDLNTSAPLWQMEGKDFFTKELDEALLNNEIDLVVHSYKDLGSERPEGIQLAAITKRFYAHDILLIRKETLPQLDQLDSFIVGTSSPRRIVNIEKSLNSYIPVKEHCSVKTKMLRGNVNTRIQKLREGEYDAIVLALAGLERLAITKESRIELEKLLENITFMVLPQSIFPSSASQGALGIECHQDNKEVLEQTAHLKDILTIEEVSRERKAFNSYGGGCHLAVGIHVKKVEDHFVHIHRGTKDGEEIQVQTYEGGFPPLAKDVKKFIGLPPEKKSPYEKVNSLTFDQYIEKVPLKTLEAPKASHYYITSSYCLEAYQSLKGKEGEEGSLWASGSKTHQLLTNEGHWVHGNADSYGEQELKSLAKSEVIGIMLGENNDSWRILSHENASSELGQVIGCYSHKEKPLTEDFISKVQEAEVFYWTSFPQFLKYKERFPEIETKSHACGLGKTYRSFKQANIPIRPFLSIDHFLNQS